MPGMLKRLASPFSGLSKEEELIAVAIERIRVQGEDELHFWRIKNGTEDADYARLMRRLRPITNELRLPIEAMLSDYGKAVKSVLFTGEDSTVQTGDDLFRIKLGRAGFVRVQAGLWVLPPSSTPQDLNQENLASWVSQAIPGFAAEDPSRPSRFELIDLSRDSSRNQAREMILRTLEASQILPGKYLYEYLKRRGITIEDLIGKADIVFLASAFSHPETLAMLEKNKAVATSKILALSRGTDLTLSSLSELPVDWLESALDGSVPHPRDFAQRLKIEAFYWQRLLG